MVDSKTIELSSKSCQIELSSEEGQSGLGIGTVKGKISEADIVNEISKNTGIAKDDVLKTVEAFMDCVKDSLAKNENVYLRGFGSFIVKERAEKTARNISKNVTIKIPAHNIPAFKPSKEFTAKVK